MDGNTKKPFISKLIQFPSGEPIAPEGYYILNQVNIGDGYGKYKLPIPVCIKEGISQAEIIRSLFDALAMYYGWDKRNIEGYVDDNPIASLNISAIGGYQIPIDTAYQVIADNTMINIILYNLALRYQWEPVELSSFEKIKRITRAQVDDKDDD